MLLLILALAALLAAAGSTFGLQLGQPYNFPNINTKDYIQYADFQMNQGWENNKLAWFICTDTSDPVMACSTRPEGEFCEGLNFAPRLASLANQVAVLYVITNLNQGPVFSAMPGDSGYSGLWEIVYVTYKTGALKHYVTNDSPYDALTNPTGLPPASDADYTTTGRAGIPIVVKYPIVAIGTLGGPWKRVALGDYRIPQGKVDEATYTSTKTIWLPYWFAYCRNPITKRIDVRRFIVPDVFDPPGLPPADQLAPKLGANVAPGLGLIQFADTQDFFWQIGPQPTNQYPIFHACPVSIRDLEQCENFDYDYTPVADFDVLQRNVPLLPAGTVINNEPTLINLIFMGRLSLIRDTQVIDAPILPETKRG